jgi:DNA topoisomerase-3
MPFQFLGKKISENQLLRMLTKKSTTNLKGFKTEHGKVEGIIRLDEAFKYKLEPKKITTPSTSTSTISCPKCKKGTVLRGKNAYGCSQYKEGCNFVFTFEKVKEIANGKPLTKELVLKIISS